LLTLCSLLNENPLENEPGHTKLCKDFIPYQKTIEYKNIDFAICDMFLKHKIPPLFQVFYPFMREQFINNYDKLLAYVKSKSGEQSIQRVSVYDMTTNVNYVHLEDKLIATKNFIDCEK
jgi:hypothetical protein